MQSKQWHLNEQDIEKWGRNVLIFCSPAIIACLVSLQGGMDWRVAFGVAGQALLSAVIDLFRKLQAS